ncbi:MAG TPA: tripartite tricarboxylate transporter TctB family protein [Symbiobacteriaceae bacterium]|nr:tripartite tricarboxylate transporter TctB family protein [Symbiobacteriaceae bacterium]
MKLTLNQKVAIGLGLFALIYTGAAWNLPRFALTTGVVDSYIFPMILGCVLLLLSAVYFVQSGGKADTKRMMADVDVPLLVKLFAATAAYAFILSTLGFVIATILFLTCNMYLLGRKKWVTNIAIATGLSMVIYTVFVYVLKVNLAKGILPF